jgi:hypothetical protein
MDMEKQLQQSIVDLNLFDSTLNQHDGVKKT